MAMRKFTSAEGHEIGLHDVCEREPRNDEATSGYFLWPDGSEGGMLLFDDGALVDYDGAFELPAAVAASLRAERFQVGPEFG